MVKASYELHNEGKRRDYFAHSGAWGLRDARTPSRVSLFK